MTTVFWYDWAGYLGVALVLLAYLLLQARMLLSNGLIYQLMNLFGATGLILSLLFGSFNLSAFVMEVAWVLISIYGLLRGWRLRREQTTDI